MAKLYFSNHARAKMELRGITMDEVRECLREGGRQAQRDGTVLHYDLITHIGVIIDWRVPLVITVVNLSKSHYKALREKEERERNSESLYGL